MKSVPRSVRRLCSGQPGGLSLLVLLGVGLGIALAGCEKAEHVTRYTVARPPAAIRKAPRPAIEADGQPGRILGAILPRDEQTWFFKMMGPAADVESQVPQFLEFLRSVHFEKSVPRWRLPEGWSEKPGDGQFRFATIVIPGETAPLELSVSPLPSAREDFDAYLLSNVNRWRDQLQVQPLKPEQLKDATLQQTIGDAKVWLVNIQGTLGGDLASGRPSRGMTPGDVRSAPGKEGASDGR